MQNEKFVIRMPNWLGDAVMATPIVADIKRHFPKAHLTVLGHAGIRDLLEADPLIDDFIVYSSDTQNLYERLRSGHFDTGILLTRSLSSAWWFFRGHVKRRIGFSAHFRRPFLTDPLAVPENEEHEHQVITNKRLLAPLGIGISQTKPVLYANRDELKAAQTHLQELGISSEHCLIGINPGAAFGSAKCWLPERFVELTRRLTANPQCRIIYFGDKNGKALVDEICKNFGPQVVNLAGATTLSSLLCYLKLCDLLVTNDSGPMHVAAALQTPLVAIFGSTNEVKTGPYDSGTIIHKHVACSPCYKRQCPIDFRCMKSITVDDLFNAICKSVKNAKLLTS